MRPLVLEAWLPKERWLVISSGERLAGMVVAWSATPGAGGQTAFQGWLELGMLYGCVCKVQFRVGDFSLLVESRRMLMRRRSRSGRLNRRQ